MLRVQKHDGLNRALSLAFELKTFCEQLILTLQAGDVSATVLENLLLRLIDADGQLSDVATVAGIVSYARAQEGDESYDVAAEFAATRAAITAAASWVLSAIPKSGGYALVAQWTATGISYRQFSSAQTATLVTLLDDIVASID